MIHVDEMFSIGIGPSSSHTVGPMRAAKMFVEKLKNDALFEQVDQVQCELFGSLGQTGKGHGSGKAVILGLMGDTPETTDVDSITARLDAVAAQQQLSLNNEKMVIFSRGAGITFHRRKTLPVHSNAMTLKAFSGDTLLCQETYYSVGGGFVLEHSNLNVDHTEEKQDNQPYPFDSANELLAHCKQSGMSISAIMLANERASRDEQQVKACVHTIWQTMESAIKRGCKTEGMIPGGLKLARRAPSLHRKLKAEQAFDRDPLNTLDWVNLFALAVSEENAAGGRIVTAPTNGAAGIIPAVLAYYNQFIQPVDEDILLDFFLTATAIGSLYKRNASISGAEVGCQGEIGVACSMAAGALAAILGGTPETIENAAEIGMEHNLGLTCDPIGGLVQVPCIERNAMGAIKAINAARLSLRGTGEHKVSLDKVIKTMNDTGRDMKAKYKETAKGGLAVNIIEC